MWVNANVYETDISRIQEGMNADIQTLAYPDRILSGHIDKIFNILDPDTKTMKVRIKLHNADFSLKPEMNATVVLSYNEKGMMNSIPASALIFDKSQNLVMVFHDKSNIETRVVSVYKLVNNTAYIRSGLEAGEKVISKNQLYIYDALND